ncbi:hypothetical protein SAMN05216464_106100 [Mucilaginibacter pineti]|uniref:Uncharacterized protein n=2 Tax=Mucilaginibacter pineti TaxID=1391627 RepID=A0A1G7CUA0_9SPHI|nr:hypothetical protein SAMN05216464_106100 [Mucilaginibacter pineti]
MVSCKPKPVSKTIDKQSARVLSASYRTKSAAKPYVDAGDIDEQKDDYADYYVVVADTGEKYNVLRDKMLDLHQSLNVPIDTMGRTYNKVKDLIALPDNDEDEIFAGDYFQRRNISNTLSLEYLQPYLSSSKNKTIALVAGIYETKMSADSVLKSIAIPNAFTIKAHIYQGCLH